jgi:hypothetical protein
MLHEKGSCLHENQKFSYFNLLAPLYYVLLGRV